MKEFLTSDKQLLEAIARETARMSYPSRMGGVVKPRTKAAVEEYFTVDFPIRDVWYKAGLVSCRFDRWHEKRAHEMSRLIRQRKLVKKNSDCAEAVAAKFLDTYMHQLMKYEQCRLLWDQLHLPLDRKILVALNRLRRSMKSSALKPLTPVFKKATKGPYSLRYDEYLEIQHALSDFIAELNDRPRCRVRLRSRIELNLLWAAPARANHR